MSTATLNVWITNLGDPCTIANDAASGLPHAWVVAVSHCDGRVVNWSEGRYRFHNEDKWTPITPHTPPGSTGPAAQGWWYDSIPTLDGHVEIELPPGCYVVRASMHTWFLNGVFYGNWATDRAVVCACCGEDVCVTLYAPTAIACWVPMFEFVIPLLQKHGVLKGDAARALEQIRGTFKDEAASPFEQNELRTLRGQFAAMAQKE
jgi:hypothetical protein